MATYTELQERVEHIIIDLPTSVTAQVPTLVKEAVRKLQKKHNFKVMEAQTAVLSTAALTRVLSAVPPDFKEFRGLPYELDALGTIRYLDIAADKAAAEDAWGSDQGGEQEDDVISGSPKAILHAVPSTDAGAANFEVYPFSDSNSLYANGEYRVVIPYYKFLAVLSAGTDTNWFTTNAEEWITWKAASEGFFLDWDEERGTLWAQKAATEYADVLKADKRLQASHITHLAPSFNSFGSRVGGKRP